MFTKNKKMRRFGTTKKKTILPIWLFSAIVGILTYNISALIKNFLMPLYNKVLIKNLNSDINELNLDMDKINLDINKLNLDLKCD